MTTDANDVLGATQPKRDRYGRPLIVPPGGGKAVAYIRATTVAETLDDRYNLELWKIRTTAKGFVARPDLFASVAAAGDDKKKLDALCSDAMEAAKASAGANMGTALHAFTEKVDRGEPVPPGPWDADVEAYRAALAGVPMLAIERFVVLDKPKVGGTPDRIVEWEGRPTIGDVKTGADLAWAWQAIAVQLAIYANADAFYDFATDAREPFPADIDKQRALVFHLPAGVGKCTIYEVDITAGWEAAQQALWVREWRKRKGLANVVALSAAVPTIAAPTTATDDALEPLRQRVRALVDAGHASALVERWPIGTPTLKEGGLTVEQVDNLAGIVSAVEFDVGLPVGTTEPEPEAKPEAPAPARWEAPDEGGDIGQDAYDAMVLQYGALTSSAKLLADSWGREAHEAQRSFSLKQRPSTRRFEIMRAVLAWATLEADADVIRGAVGLVIGDEVQPAVTAGAALGSLSTTEASRLAELAHALDGGSVVIHLHPEGVVRFTGDTAAYAA